MNSLPGNALLWVFYSVQIILLIFLLFPFLNTFVGLFLSRAKVKSSADSVKDTDFAIIITAYKDVLITLPSVDSLLKQKYSNYHIYLVADNCTPLEYPLSSDKLSVLFPSPFLNSKTKSILHAIENLSSTHDYIVIFDPDNLAHPDYLNEINRFCSKGYRAIQGRRAPKNLDTVYSRIDALSDYYYNHTQRLIPFLLGSSATIAGSGMAIESKTYTRMVQEIENENLSKPIIVAEDKMLQNKLVLEDNIIAYAPDAIVYDEKTSSGAQVTQQRTRWLNSYFLHLLDSLRIIFKGIAAFNFNITYFGLVISTPPLVIIGLYSLLFLGVNFVISIQMAIAWLIGFSIFLINVVLSAYLSNAEKEILYSVPKLPLFVFNQILALFRLKRSNKEFMVTEKSKTIYIDDILKQKQNKQ